MEFNFLASTSEKNLDGEQGNADWPEFLQPVLTKYIQMFELSTGLPPK